MRGRHRLVAATARFTTALVLLALLAAAAARTAAADLAARPRIPVILDTDIGDDIDDTWALVLALKSPELDVKLVVTDFGNTEHRAKIVARLLEIAGRTDIPIGIGIRENDAESPQSEWVKDYDLSSYPGRVLKDGVQALIDTAMGSSEPVTLIAIGPPPNVRAALEREPRIAGKLRLAGMYGSLRRGYSGKPKPEAEWNVRASPAAARALLGAPWAEAISTPLDTCGLVRLQGERYARVRNSQDPLLRALIENYRLFCQRKEWCAKDVEFVTARSSTLFDTVAVYLASSRDLVRTEDLGVRVTDEGMTLLDPAARPLTWATEWRDLDGFEQWLVARLTAPPAAGPPSRRMSRATLEDKVRGGWAGQMIGVAFGAPTEFKSNGRILEGELRWTPEMIANTIHQDDLYVEMTFAEVMDRIGLDATTEQYGEMFRDSKYSLWHANAGARRNLDRGFKAPMSGHPDFNVHANDIDFQIESDFIGLMCPGLPQASNYYADRVGRVMNYGDGLYGGMFFGAMYAAAFFETDPHRVVEQGLRAIPAESSYAHVVRDVLAWHAQDPSDWRKTWHLIEEKWDRDDLCPDGALAPFNIDARLNGAYVVLGLLYGDADFGKTLEISTRAGQDSDCNPSSAAGILGVMLGYERIPATWKAGIPALADTKFEFTSYSLNEIVASTLTRAEKVIVAAGGTVGPGELLIPLQSPQPPPLEQWDPGVPVARVEFGKPAWSWRGAPGAWDEATFAFDGTGVAIVGVMSQEGGRADVYLDGVQAGIVDAWIPERTHDNDYWHATGLANARHSVRIVRRAGADSRSKGRRLQIERAIVYGPRS